MGISFQNPLFLLLLPVVIFFLIYINRSRLFESSRIKFIAVIRLILFTLIIFSLSGINIKTDIDTTTTILAIDRSESTEQSKEEFEAFIGNALEYAKENDRVGVISFGEKSEVEVSVSAKVDDFKFETKINKGFTNIEKALNLARALIPEDSKKRIVLITDGKENVGNSLKEGKILNTKDIELKIYKKDSFVKDEVQLKNIDIPKVLYENQLFDVILDIYSNTPTKSKVTLFSDNNVVGEKDVKLEKGNNRFVFRDKAIGSGFRALKAVITPEKDTFTQNNTYSAFTDIKGVPEVLLVHGESDGGRELKKIMTSASIQVDYVDSKVVPTELSNLLKYKGIIMSDVSLHSVNEKFMESLQMYVRDYGGGLIVTGGENSFALGGYYKTKLEEMLPVNMEMKIKGEVPSLGLMLVIDKSGSMESGEVGVSKIEIAKEAAIKAVNSLKPKDQIGVITFDDTPQWVIKPSANQREEELIDEIATIRADGGTSIIPALEEAYNALEKIDTKLKHVILLTDGQAERYGYDSLLSNMAEAGITISTVAVGEGADTGLLEWVAEVGDGRYYFVDEYGAIPEIFSKETFLASKTYINNRTFIPKIASSKDIIKPIIGESIALDGYISTSAKDRGEILLTSDADEPILATWQYGLGRSTAWTSDTNGKWTSDYLASDSGIEFFNKMVLSVFYKGGNESLLVEINTEGNVAKISVKDLKDSNKVYDTKATVITPSYEKVDIDLVTSNISEYDGEIEALEKGTYIIKVQQYEDGNVVRSTQEAFTINYSKEYDITDTSGNLSELVTKSNGEFINNPDEVFTRSQNDVYGYRDISDILIIISLIIFIGDIALRRLNLSFNKGINTTKKKVLQSTNYVKYKLNKKDGKSISSIPKTNKVKLDEAEVYIAKEARKSKDKKNDEKKSDSINTNRLLKAKNKRKR